MHQPSSVTATSRAYTTGARLAEIVRRWPERTAIVERDARVTFQELDDAASAIAACIVDRCGDRHGRVGLYFERKIPAIEAMFGAGRAGFAYVVLDAGDPQERTRLVLRDSEPAALFTEHALLERARAIAPRGCVTLDMEDLEHDPRPLVSPEVAPDSPVYLWYTSGSTGQPKGVVQTHRNLLLSAGGCAQALSLDHRDRHSLLYTLSFNASCPDIFGGMLNGATLCAYDLRRDGLPWLADWLDRERITVLHCVPTVFRELFARMQDRRILPHLRVVDLGGEAVFGTDIELFKRHTLSSCVLVNQLASTEGGVIAQHVVTHASAGTGVSVVPVGRCLDGVRVEIRAEDGRRAAVDEVGEMIVCGEQVSVGYWRRQELDAATFSYDPADPSIRRYRSGDLGRVDAAGVLHYIGRNGSRVKIHGQSVELSEVEAALTACTHVARAAVLARQTGAHSDACRLVAFIATEQAERADPAAIRRELATRIPAYMFPADIVFMDALPLTASGKVDRNALSALKPRAAEATRAIAPPLDDIEARVAEIVSTLLGVPAVGRDDDFFLLGGDSLRGIELQLRVREAFGVHLGSLHEDATVARIAALVRGAAKTPSELRALPVLIPLWRDGSAPPLFLMHGRHGQAFVSPLFMHLLGDDQPVWAFQARGLDGLQQPHASVDDMASEYLAALRKVRPHGPYFLGAVCAGAYIAAILARALRDAGETVLPLLLLDPPDRLVDGGYLRIGEARFLAKMKARRAAGGSLLPIEDPTYMKALLRVAAAFEHALARHRPKPYDGPAFMLSSRQRIEAAGIDALGNVFVGDVKRYEVGATHAEALDPRNAVFANRLLDCVAVIREAAANVPAA